MTTSTVEPQTVTGAIEEVDLVPFEDTDDPEWKTHIVRPGDNLHVLRGPGVRGSDIVFAARMSGTEVVALCGFKFVPKHNPDKYPACQPCFHLAGQIHRGERP